MVALLKNPGIDPSSAELGRFVPDPYGNRRAVLNAVAPRIIKSHEPYDPRYPRVVYIHRDGRDALLSWHDMRRKTQGLNENFESFVRRALEGDEAFGPWQRHVQSWVLTPHDTPILRVGYERLWSDPSAELAAIARFLSLPADEESIAAAVRRSGLDAHARFLERNRPEFWKSGYTGGLGGVPGGWRHAFSADLRDFFWDRAGDAMLALGYGER
jgi:hypothetical protein